MKLVLKLLTTFFLVALFVSVVKAAPILSEQLPPNYSYIYGKDTDVFSVNATDAAFNSTSALLFARVDDPTSLWTNKSMTCINVEANKWTCNTTLPGLNALVNDGNWLLFYFNASNTTFDYGNLGNSTDPLRVRIDRSPPDISFKVPLNNSYTSGKIKIKMEVTDKYSGVNYSTVNYSFDNSTWFTTSVSDSYFIASVDWNTSTYLNNQTVSIYGKASDVLGNDRYVKIQTTVDNEIPGLTITNPKAYQVITTNVLINVTAVDTYAGIDTANVKFSVGSTSGIFSCSGTIYNSYCTSTLVPNVVEDGNQTLTVTALDRAVNSIAASIPILIDNLPPTIQITSPSATNVVRDNLQISAIVSDSGIGVENASFRWESGSVGGSWNLLNCQGNPKSYNCSLVWNTKTVVDGTYTIRFMAYDKIGRQATAGAQIGISNGISGTPTGQPITTTLPSGTTTTTSAQQPASNIGISFESLLKGKETLVFIVIVVGAVFVVLFGVYSAYKLALPH